MADRKKFDVSLVTPEGPAFEGEAELLIVPGAAGDIGVLARHAPLVALLKAGSTRIYRDRASEDVLEFATGPGFFKVERFLSQPMNVAETFTGQPGVYVRVEETIQGFQEIIDGKHDELPEQAFYMVGPIEMAVEKGRQLGGGGREREEEQGEDVEIAEDAREPEPAAV